MSSWAKVGVRCICIRAETIGSWRGLAPVNGQTYVITKFSQSMFTDVPQAHFATLDGLPIHENCRVKLDRFRPLITRTQDEDVDAFKSLLQDMPLTERLDRIGELLG